MTPAISLEQVAKRYAGVDAVQDVSVDVAEGEFFSLLGPSGCGKTTTLRMIAGFVTPDSGRIVLQGRDVTSVPPNRRPVNMVFQQYALFPHMSVYDNVAFGLSVKHVPRREHRTRVVDLLEVVSLAGYERRRPREHRFARTRRTDQQARVTAGRRDLQRALRALLPNDVGKVVVLALLRNASRCLRRR